jgi:hypothetical protein
MVLNGKSRNLDEDIAVSEIIFVQRNKFCYFYPSQFLLNLSFFLCFSLLFGFSCIYSLQWNCLHVAFTYFLI